MICGGTGIAPMYQALCKLMNTTSDERRVVLLYGNHTPADILLKDELHTWARKQRHRLTIVHCIGTAHARDNARPDGWRDTDEFVAETGWVDEAKVRKYAFPPSEDTLVFVCGIPALYEGMCGPRSEKALPDGSTLAKLGYTESMVSKM